MSDVQLQPWTFLNPLPASFRSILIYILILTLCFHFMHWTNSSCIKWASLPLCFIFFGSSFWYLKLENLVKSLVWKVNLKWKFSLRGRLINENIVFSCWPHAHTWNSPVARTHTTGENLTQFRMILVVCVNRKKKLFFHHQIFDKFLTLCADYASLFTVFRFVHSKNIDFLFLSMRLEAWNHTKEKQNVTAKFSLLNWNIFEVNLWPSTRTIHQAWSALPASSFLPLSVSAPADIASARSRTGERYHGGKI